MSVPGHRSRRFEAGRGGARRVGLPAMGYTSYSSVDVAPVSQAQGGAPPPQVAESRAKTTLSRFGVARDRAGPGTMPGSSA